MAQKDRFFTCQRCIVWIEPDTMLKNICTMMNGKWVFPSSSSCTIFQRSSRAILRRAWDASRYRVRTAAIASDTVCRRSPLGRRENGRQTEPRYPVKISWQYLHRCSTCPSSPPSAYFGSTCATVAFQATPTSSCVIFIIATDR